MAENSNSERPSSPQIAHSVSDFCAAASISRTTFYEEVKGGRIKIVKCGRRTLIPADEGRAWLQRLAGGDRARTA